MHILNLLKELQCCSEGVLDEEASLKIKNLMNEIEKLWLVAKITS